MADETVRDILELLKRSIQLQEGSRELMKVQVENMNRAIERLSNSTDKHTDVLGSLPKEISSAIISTVDRSYKSQEQMLFNLDKALYNHQSNAEELVEDATTDIKATIAQTFGWRKDIIDFLKLLAALLTAATIIWGMITRDPPTVKTEPAAQPSISNPFSK